MATPIDAPLPTPCSCALLLLRTCREYWVLLRDLKGGWYPTTHIVLLRKSSCSARPDPPHPTRRSSSSARPPATHTHHRPPRILRGACPPPRRSILLLRLLSPTPFPTPPATLSLLSSPLSACCSSLRSGIELLVWPASPQPKSKNKSASNNVERSALRCTVPIEKLIGVNK